MAANAQAKFQQALSLHQNGHLPQAKTLYEEILVAHPNHFDALHLLGVIAHQNKNHRRAVDLIGKAIELSPRDAAFHYHRGLALQALKQLDAAVASYDKAIALKPDLAEACSNRGLALQELKQLDAAVASFDQAIALKPDYAEAYYNRGIALEELQQFDAAVVSYDKAIALKPDYAEAYSNRGNALKKLKQLDAAIASYDQAIALKPDYAEAHYNRGIALEQLWQLDAAVASYGQAIALKPDYAEAYWNRSLVLLLLGHFDRGWEDYEWRWKNKRLDLIGRNFRQPLWLGKESIAGKTILLHGEQGFGDTIQFCRYARLVADLGASVILEIHESLVSLLASLEGVTQLVTRGNNLPAFDYQCPLMSLPLALKTTLSTIPANIPYLQANAEKSRFWQEKLGDKNRPRVGLVWSGGFRRNQPEAWSVNSWRNIPLAKLAALKNPDIEFYSLQKGQPAESELAELIKNNWDGPHIVDYTSLLNDFSDTAALIENLDLVISVDTSTAHLAGALGKPVWILNRFETDWRWLLERTDSPWYPTAKLYRQQKAGDWDAVVQRVKADLMSFHTGKGN